MSLRRSVEHTRSDDQADAPPVIVHPPDRHAGLRTSFAQQPADHQARSDLCGGGLVRLIWATRGPVLPPGSLGQHMAKITDTQLVGDISLTDIRYNSQERQTGGAP